MAYAQEKVNPYGREGAKGKLVKDMFDHIAPTYDTLNHRLSLNIDSRWRRKTVDSLLTLRPQQVLDIATGTADLAILTAQRLHPKSITAADISQEMMELGREKVKKAHLEESIHFATEDCMELSFADNSFDAVTSAFGIRNFQDLDRGLKEIHRVLRPGGMFVAVEATTPANFPMRELFKVYSNVVIPVWGKIVSGDEGAYEYLTESVSAFPQGEEMKEILLRAGFKEAEFHRMTFGVATRYIATK